MQELFTTAYLMQFLVGILVLVVIFLVSRLALGSEFWGVRRAVGVFAVACAALTVIWLRQNPGFAEEYAGKIASAAIALVVAFLVFLRRHIS